MSIMSGFTIIKNNVGELVKNIGVLNTHLKVHTMRPLQKIVFEYWNVQRFLLSSPPGSGKSAIVKFVVSWLLKQNPNLKVVIVVPYLVLTKSFGSIVLEYQNGEKIPWDIDLNLCEDSNAPSKIDELNDFITRKTNLFASVAISSHRTLALLNQKYPDNKYDDVMFIIDEAHHVLYPEEGNESESANKIGELIHNLYTQNNPTVKIWFLTATFYRGDKYSIIPTEMMDTFTTYHLPLDEYWQNYIRHIKTFEYNFVIYKKNDVFNEIKEIFKTKGKRKTIIYCPYNGYLLKGHTKLRFRDKIMRSIREVWSDCKILDLVQVEGRSEIKDMVIENSIDFDVVLAVKLFDEGTDWEQAESIIDLAPSNSLRIQVQRFGRLIRDYPGKSHIDYNVFFPYEVDFTDEEERRLHMSKCFNAFIASCLLHNAIEPVEHPKSVKQEIDDTNHESEKPEDYVREDPLSIAFPDESQKQQVLADVFKNLGLLASINKELTSDEAKECIFNSLKKLGVTSNFEAIAIQIVRMFDRETNPKLPRNPDWLEQTTNVEFMIDAGFDKVWNNEILKGMLAFTTSFCGVKDFTEFREIYTKQKTKEEWYIIAKKFEVDNGGILPSSTAFRKKYGALFCCMKKHPEFFKDINRLTRVNNKTVDEWLLFTKDLVKKNGGRKLKTNELRKHFPALSTTISRNKGLFKDLVIQNRRPRIIKTDEEWVKYGNKLALKNNNSLPLFKILFRDHNSFYNFFKKRPELFNHLKTDSCKTLSSEDWVELYLSHISNGGTFDSLDKKTKQGIRRAMNKKPDLFKGHVETKIKYVKRKNNAPLQTA